MSDGITGTDGLDLLGPNLRWGEPLGTYEFEVTSGGGVFSYREMRPSGDMLEVRIPMDVKALAEMIGLLNLLDLPADLKPELPNVRIRGHA